MMVILNLYFPELQDFVLSEIAQRGACASIQCGEKNNSWKQPV